MAKYYVNKKKDSKGDHEVHKQGCRWMPKEENRIYLGDFTSCEQAVSTAKAYYDHVNGCYFCSNECHTG